MLEEINLPIENFQTALLQIDRIRAAEIYVGYCVHVRHVPSYLGFTKISQNPIVMFPHTQGAKISSREIKKKLNGLSESTQAFNKLIEGQDNLTDG